MSTTIRVTDTTYKRLESHAKGFDTPDSVIDRLLDFYEKNAKGKKDVVSEDSTESPDERISALVKRHARKILKYSINNDEIGKLKSKAHSKQMLGIYFPFCIELDSGNKGKIPRYWKKVYEVEGRHFVITSEWYERNRGYLVAWLKQKGLLSTESAKGPYRGLHHWTKEDDVVAYYLYRFGTDDLDLSLEEIAEKLGMSARSMRMRIQNFQAIDGKGGLSNAARLSKKVYEEYKTLSKKKHKSEVDKILGKLKN